VKKLWYIVVRYSPVDWAGEPIDAHWIDASPEHAQAAMRRTSVSTPMRPGQLLRGYWAMTEEATAEAIRVHDRKLTEDHNWEQLVEHIEAGWMRAQHGVA